MEDASRWLRERLERPVDLAGGPMPGMVVASDGVVRLVADVRLQADLVLDAVVDTNGYMLDTNGYRLTCRGVGGRGRLGPVAPAWNPSPAEPGATEIARLEAALAAARGGRSSAPNREQRRRMERAARRGAKLVQR